MRDLLRLESPRLQRFQRALRRQRRSAEESFWKEMHRSGTPLIEPVEGDSSRSWVTYLWRGTPGTRSIGLQGPQTELGEFDRLDRLPGSNLWFGTWNVKNDFMGVYRFFPNLPRTLPDERSTYLRLSKSGVVDPLNPIQFDSPTNPEFPDHPIYGKRSSVLRLKDAPHPPSGPAPSSGTPGTLTLHWMTSRRLKNRRRIWTYVPSRAGKSPAEPRLVIFFDGFAYVNEIAAPSTLDGLIERGVISPTYAVFVDALDQPTRSRELPCNPEFEVFLLKELLPWIRRALGRSFTAERTSLVGFSYGGLCATYCAMRHPRRFGGVISQSGSFWWRPKDSDEPVALAREFMRRPKLPLRIYMDVGRYEGSAPTENGSGQLGSNRHLRDVLRLLGYPIMFRTYNGGHDTYCWRQTLIDALEWVLS